MKSNHESYIVDIGILKNLHIKASLILVQRFNINSHLLRQLKRIRYTENPYKHRKSVCMGLPILLKLDNLSRLLSSSRHYLRMRHMGTHGDIRGHTGDICDSMLENWRENRKKSYVTIEIHKEQIVWSVESLITIFIVEKLLPKPKYSMIIRRLNCLIAISSTDIVEDLKAGVCNQVAIAMKSISPSKPASYRAYCLNCPASHPPLFCCQWDDQEGQQVQLELSGRASHHDVQ